MTNSQTTNRSLNSRKRQVTRDLILDALAEVIAEKGLDGFSVQDVADKAGLSHRTVYRIFDSREALIDGSRKMFEEWAAEKGIGMPTDLDAVPERCEELYRALDERAELAAAGAIYDSTRGAQQQPESRRERTQRMQRMLEERFPTLPEEEIIRAGSIIRLMFSGLTWHTLNSQYGLPGSRSGPYVRWAIEVLIAELRRREAEIAQQDPTEGTN
jgi:AcrR family transcriptional regulator